MLASDDKDLIVDLMKPSGPALPPAVSLAGRKLCENQISSWDPPEMTLRSIRPNFGRDDCVRPLSARPVEETSSTEPRNGAAFFSHRP